MTITTPLSGTVDYSKANTRYNPIVHRRDTPHREFVDYVPDPEPKIAQNLTTLASVIPQIFKGVQNLKDGHVAILS